MPQWSRLQSPKWHCVGAIGGRQWVLVRVYLGCTWVVLALYLRCRFLDQSFSTTTLTDFCFCFGSFLFHRRRPTPNSSIFSDCRQGHFTTNRDALAQDRCCPPGKCNITQSPNTDGTCLVLRILRLLLLVLLLERITLAVVLIQGFIYVCIAYMHL